MIGGELQPSSLVHRQPDKLLRRKRALMSVEGKQLDVPAVVERRDHAGRLVEDAPGQGPGPGVMTADTIRRLDC
jgi:hypothetical protein